jgi:hypothetical protein
MVDLLRYENRRGRGRKASFFYFLFLLKEKETKSSRRFDAGLSDGGRFPRTNRRLEVQIIRRAFGAVTTLRAMMRFMEALYFLPG